MNWITYKCDKAEIQCNLYGCPVDQPRIEDAADVKCTDFPDCTPVCCKPEVRCDSYAESCPRDQPVVDDAANVVCTEGVCSTSQCCKPEVRCDSYADKCPGGNQPLIPNASKVVCRNGVCGLPQCCRRLKYCNSWIHCPEDHILKQNAHLIVCNAPNGDCRNARCCRRDPKCPRNLNRGDRCGNGPDCKCKKPNKCRGVGNPETHKECHC